MNAEPLFLFYAFFIISIYCFTHFSIESISTYSFFSCGFTGPGPNIILSPSRKLASVINGAVFISLDTELSHLNADIFSTFSYFAFYFMHNFSTNCVILSSFILIVLKSKYISQLSGTELIPTPPFIIPTLNVEYGIEKDSSISFFISFS